MVNPVSIPSQDIISAADRAFFQSRGKAIESVASEYQFLTSKPVYPSTVSPATLENGKIVALSPKQLDVERRNFIELSKHNRLEFVVPAAGAATRLSQILKTILNQPSFEGLSTPNQIQLIATEKVRELSGAQNLSEADKANLKLFQEVKTDLVSFWEKGICEKQYAFWEDLEIVMAKRGLSLRDSILKDDLKTVAHYILSADGLNYGSLPKLLMKMHAYPNIDGTRECRLGLEEHIRDVAKLMQNKREVRLHLPISDEHQALIETALEEIWNRPSFQKDMAELGFSKTNVHITFSFQSPSTDTIAIDLTTNEMVRDANGKPLLRKAGHGAVLPNLTNLACDGLWLKNVDNVLYDNPKIKEAVILAKQVQAGLALSLQKEAHHLVEQLVSTITLKEENPKLNQAAIAFIQECLQLDITSDLRLESSLEVSKKLKELLDRPIAVCGFVPLEKGQAGGGPFVIETEIGGLRVRKVSTLEQAEFEGGAGNHVFKSGQFFNPVLLFIAKRKYDGSLHDLSKCLDASRAFSSQKTDAQGRVIKVMELPGLWNGSLANALQVNIALPGSVFSAVKTLAGQESFLAKLHQNSPDVPVVSARDQECGIESFSI